MKLKNLREVKCNASCEHRMLEGKQLFRQKLYKTATSSPGDIGGQNIIMSVKGIIHVFII